MLIGFGYKGLTINQSRILEILGAGLFSFCLVKCIKCLVKIGCPLDGEPPLIIDDKEEEKTNGSIQEEQPAMLTLKRN